MFSSLRQAASRAWGASFGKHLLLTNCVSCGGFFMLGDAIQQRLEMAQNPAKKFDMTRSVRLGLVGLSQVNKRISVKKRRSILISLGSSTPLLVSLPRQASSWQIKSSCHQENPCRPGGRSSLLCHHFHLWSRIAGGKLTARVLDRVQVQVSHHLSV